MSGFSQFLAFATTARHGGFAQAGRELGVTASTVAKRIMRLEEQLGVKLFHRTTRQVTLTSDGSALFARCEKVLADIEEIESLASGAGGEVRGKLRLNVPITYGKRIVMPVLAQLLGAHRELHLEVRLSDAFCDLIKDGVDAAIRVGPLNDSQLAARRIDWQELVVCASPDYLERHRKPAHPERLGKHAFILFRNPTSGRERPLQFQIGGRPVELTPSTRMVLDDGEGMAEAARLGLGLTQVPHYMAEHALEHGTLVEVLGSFRPPPQPVSVVWPGNRLMPARVRVLIDALAAARGGE
jgi:LysR family transcriptional regulator for bpeEF and oprC